MNIRNLVIAGPIRRLAAHTSLRLQFLFLLLLTLGLALASSYWVSTRVEARALEEVRTYVESASRAVQVSVSRVRESTSGLEIITLEAEAVPVGVTRVTLTDIEGRVLAQTLNAAVEDTDVVSYRIPLVEGGRLTGYLDVDLSASRLRDVFRDMLVSKVLLTIVVFLLGVLLLIPVASAVSQSHMEVENLAASVAAGDLDPDFPEPMSREADGLFGSFRTLLARLRQQREAELELSRSEREASIGRMTSGVAHDIRNPLNYVELGVGELWRKRQGVGEPGPEEQALYEGIRQELRRVNQITDDLLVFGRPLIPDIQTEDAGGILGGSRDGLERLRPDRRGDISVELPEETLWVLADRDLTERVLTNVIANALDATEPGDRIRTGLAAEGDRRVLFWIEDSGPGLPPNVIEHMFEPYVTGKSSGTGLGLALASRWVKDMNGDIVVKNLPTTGARVEIRLPGPEGRGL